MFRGSSNPDYRRPPVPPSGFVQPPSSFGPPPFCPPYNGPPGPGYCGPPLGPPSGLLQASAYSTLYENRSFTSHNAAQSVSTQSTLLSPQLASSNQPQLGHSSQSWSTQKQDEQNQEVRKKAEEFLRILEASSRIEQTGDKSSSGDHTSDKRLHSRGRSRSRGKSRPRSRSRSHDRSRGHSRARSRCRGKSRARSRSRSGSRSRAKSRTRAKSRPRSRSGSRSRGKSVTRSKSQPRQSPSKSKPSFTVTVGNNHSSTGTNVGGSTMPDLFYGLREILQNKDLDKHLPLVKNALLRNQSSEETKGTFLENQPAITGFQNYEPKLQPEISAGLNYGSLLPHERVGGSSSSSSSFSNILFWNTSNQQPEIKPEIHSVEDEEKFLYGEEEERAKPQAVTVPLAQSISVRSPVYHDVGKEPHYQSLQEPKAPATPGIQPAGSGPVKVTPDDCEKVRNLLRTIGLNPGMADICKMAARLKEKREEPGGASAQQPLKPALEFLQALSKASKSDDSRSNRSGSNHSNRESKREKKVDEKEKEKREKQIQKKRKEYLVKELEGLLKQEGSGDLIPVMGFFCQRCEEFFGDLHSAQKHVDGHKHGEKKQVGSQEQHRDAKRHGDQQQTSSHKRESPANKGEKSRVHQDHKEHSPDRKRIKDEKHPQTQHESEVKHSKDESKDKPKDKQDDNEDAESTKSEKKKKKKEKKLKKKEKKKKKDKKKEEAGSP
ncbi:uncharacterized protein [Paramisgurnus dabryanus]|uniref:uncharacterized protein n=1 Tax=Paramisgurnus dabryanus TaxID=90735 RepID=UPI0031F37B1D